MELPNKKLFLFIAISSSYFVFCLLSFLFKGINSAVLLMSGHIIDFIPSVINTAEITKNKESSMAVLALSWVFSITTWAALNIENKWKGFSPEGSNKPSSGIMIGAFLVSWLFLFLFFSFSPSDFVTVDGRGEFLYAMLVRYDYFVIFYGYILMILMASVWNAISGIPIYFLRSMKSKGLGK